MSARRIVALVGLLALTGCEGAPKSGVVGTPAPSLTEAEVAALKPVRTQTVYVPVYSHVNTGNVGAAFNLAVTLAVRNTDASTSIVLTAVDYHDTSGRKVRSWLERPVRLGPMATFEVFVREDDTTGGVGASFRVTWLAESAVSEPLVEAVHAGTASAQGISFVTRGVALETPR